MQKKFIEKKYRNLTLSGGHRLYPQKAHFKKHSANFKSLKPEFRLENTNQLTGALIQSKLVFFSHEYPNTAMWVVQY